MLISMKHMSKLEKIFDSDKRLQLKLHLEIAFPGIFVHIQILAVLCLDVVGFSLCFLWVDGPHPITVLNIYLSILKLRLTSDFRELLHLQSGYHGCFTKY